MLQVKKILFPTDFSSTSDAALASACHWARRLGAELHIFHALESLRPDLYPASLELPYQTLEQSTCEQLEVRRRLASNQGATVVCASHQGFSPAPMILSYAEANDIDMIAISTHGRRGVRRLLLGSVAEEVVQRSSSPVLTIVGARRPEHSLSPGRILVAVDLSEHSAELVAHAKHVAAFFQAEVQLLHVLVRTPTPAYYDAVGLPTFVFDTPLLEKETQSALEAAYEDAAGPSGPVSVHVEHGFAVEQILRFADVNSSDLVMVASHGLSGAAHLLMGSVAERVVRQAACPVLTIKSFGRSLITEESRARVAAQA